MCLKYIYQNYTKYFIAPVTQETYHMVFNEITKFTFVTATKTYHIK
jgi:hypothetical protein